MKSPLRRLRLFGLSVSLLSFFPLSSRAEFTWPQANSADDATLICLPLNSSLDETSADGAKLIAITDLNDIRSARNPGTPAFAPGPPHLDQALKMAPDNILRSAYVNLQPPGEFTLSFWTKISQPGFLAFIGFSGGNPEQDFFINLKAKSNGEVYCSNRLGEGHWQEKSEVCDIADGAWHHVAIVVKPDAGGAQSSSLKVWMDGKPAIELTPDGQAGGRAFFTLGASPNEFSMERGGPGADMLVDEILFENRALEKPNSPLE